MRYRLLIFFLFCVLLVFLLGCWDREELQQLSIVLGMVIDKGSNKVKNRYRVMV